MIIRDLTKREKKAIRGLKRLAKKWPTTLSLGVDDGELVVVFTENDVVAHIAQIRGGH